METINLADELNELKINCGYSFRQQLNKVNKKIAFKLSKSIQLITGIQLNESKNYPTSGLILKKASVINEMIYLTYVFEYGIIKCQMNKYSNIPDNYKIRFSSAFARTQKMYRSIFELELKDNLDLIIAASSYGKVDIRETMSDIYSPSVGVELKLEICPQKRNIIVMYRGFPKFEKAELKTSKENNIFYDDFKKYLELVAKTNEKVMDNYPTKKELINSYSKFKKMLKLFINDHENNYERLQKDLELLRMLTI